MMKTLVPALSCVVPLLTLSTALPANAASVTYTNAECVSFAKTVLPSGDLSLSCVRAPAVTVPQCSLAASPATVSGGAQSILTATCAPAATSYVWTNATSSSATATVTPTATTTYSVRGANSAGAGNVASAVVTVSAPAAVPQCTLSAAPSVLNAPGWVILTATCAPAATSYNWANITGNTSSVYVTATSNFSVRGSNAAGQGKLATTTVTIGTAPPVTPPPIATVPAYCGSLAVTHYPMSWADDNARVYYNRTMGRGQAHIYSFTTGPAESALASFSIAEYAGSVPTRTVVISKLPCDFTTSDPTLPKLVGTSGTGYFTVGVVLDRRIKLEANTKYFANIKNENPYSNPGQDACLANENCGYRFNLNHSGK